MHMSCRLLFYFCYIVLAYIAEVSRQIDEHVDTDYFCYIFMDDTVMALYRYGLYGCGLYTYGLYSYDLSLPI